MQQIEIYLAGERNYAKIHGDTGPLVYPAMHVYIYRWLYEFTQGGTNILLAQVFFAILYIFTLGVVMACYRRAKVCLVNFSREGKNHNSRVYYNALLIPRNRLHHTSTQCSFYQSVFTASSSLDVSTTASPFHSCSSPSISFKENNGTSVQSSFPWDSESR